MTFAPEVAVEVTFGIAEFATLFALVGLLCLRFIWAGTFGFLFGKLADLFSFHTPGVFGVGRTQPLGAVARFLRSVDNTVYEAIGNGIHSTEYAWHKLLLWNAYILTKTGDELAAVAQDTLAALHILHGRVNVAHALARQALTRAEVPAAVVKVATPKPVASRVATEQYDTLAAKVAKLEATVSALHTPATIVVQPAAVASTGAVAAPAPIARPLPIPGLKGLTDGVKDVTARVRNLGWLGVFGGVLALSGAVLSRLKLGWLKCSNVDRLGRAVCRMDYDLLGSLLAGAVVIAGAISIVDFAKVMLAAEDEIVSGLRRGFRELHGVEPLQFEGYTGTLG